MRTLLALALLSASLPAVTLTENGRSSYKICISASASPSERRGAQELQRFIQEMSGAQLPIVEDSSSPKGDLVLLGDSAVLKTRHAAIDVSKLGPEEFVLESAGRDLVIAGGRKRGTMYGVYTFLDKLGCRWYTSEVSRIPKQKTIRVADLHEKHAPAFEYRDPFFPEAFPRDWAARNRTNGNSQHLDESTGGQMLYNPFVHSFNALLPPEKYFKTHPEYYSLVDGKRRAEYSQLCLTNPEVLRLAVARVREWIHDRPEAAIISVSQNDWEGWCECDRCRKVEEEEGGVHSGPILRFVNALATEIEKTNPDKLIDTLAYWYSEEPPTHVRPRPNVRVRLCPIGICVSHSFAQCPRSAYFYRNLQAWSKITDQLYIWHYNTNFAHYLAPFPDFGELAADIPLYRRSGVKGIFLEGTVMTPNGENAELRSYIMARLLWDTATNVNAEIDGFMDAVYGPAAKSLRKYFDLLHAQGQHLWIYDVPDYSDEFLSRARQLFREAEAAVENDPPFLRRVQKARLSVDYFEAMKKMRFEVRGDVYAPADPGDARQSMQTVIENARRFDMSTLFEGGQIADSDKMLPRIRAYPVKSLENGAWRLDVVPEFDGRVVRLIDKRSGRDLLRRPALGERHGIPNEGGLAMAVHPDAHSERWTVEWSASDPSGDAVALTGKASNGLAIRRNLRLTEDAVRVETVVENPTSSPIECVLNTSGDFDPVDIDKAVLSFRSRDGKETAKRLVPDGAKPDGSQSWDAGEQPAGSWTVRGALSSRFEGDSPARSYASWTAKSHPRVTLGQWTSPRTLKPGESFRVASEYLRAE